VLWPGLATFADDVVAVRRELEAAAAAGVSALQSPRLAKRVGPRELVTMGDITTEADVKRVVDEFYGAIRRDELLNPIFSDVAQVDWAHHLPKMYAFWNQIVLGIIGYTGAPFPPHTKLPVRQEHFTRWVELFHRTVDADFAGPGAKRAKDAAASIAHTFAMRLGVMEWRF